MIIWVILGLCAAVALFAIFVIGAGIDLVVYLLSAIWPFIWCTAAGMLGTEIILALLHSVFRSSKVRDTLEKINIPTAVAVGLICFLLFMYAPRNALPFSTEDVAYVAYYDLHTAKSTDYVDSDERIAQLREILGGMKMHHHHAKRIPDYLKSLGRVDVAMWIGIYDSAGVKLAELRLTEGKLIEVYYPDTEKTKLYKLYQKPDLERLDAIRKEETYERTKNRIVRDNEASIQACFDNATYENGELVVPLQDLVYQDSLALSLDALAQDLRFSYAWQNLDLLKEAGMSNSFYNCDSARIPIPQGRKFGELKLVISLDGIKYSRDLVNLLPEAMIKPRK